VTLLAIGLTSHRADAQQLEIGAQAGWPFGGALDTDRGRLTLDPTLAWGGHIDFWVRPDGLGEVLYQRQRTTAAITDPLEPADSLLELTVHYAHLGGLYEPAQGLVRPFGGATAGVAVLDPRGSNRSAVTRFSLSFVGGGKLYAGRHVGLRAEARVFLTTFADTTELFCRLPGGCYVSATGQILAQLQLAASVFLRF
jgi:hypothetical protein